MHFLLNTYLKMFLHVSEK